MRYVLWRRVAVVLPQVVGFHHDMRAYWKLYAEFILPASPLIEAGVIKNFGVHVRRALKPALFEVVLQTQPVTVSSGKWCALNEAELTSVSVRNH